MRFIPMRWNLGEGNVVSSSTSRTWRQTGMAFRGIPRVLTMKIGLRTTTMAARGRAGERACGRVSEGGGSGGVEEWRDVMETGTTRKGRIGAAGEGRGRPEE